MAVLLLTGCSFLGSDAFEDWEPASDDFLQALPPEVLAEFTDATHSIAYALATDCFAATAPRSDLDEAIAVACDTEDWGRLSDIMTVDDLCRRSRFNGNSDVPDINGGALCG